MPEASDRWGITFTRVRVPNVEIGIWDNMSAQIERANREITSQNQLVVKIYWLFEFSRGISLQPRQNTRIFGSEQRIARSEQLVASSESTACAGPRKSTGQRVHSERISTIPIFIRPQPWRYLNWRNNSRGSRMDGLARRAGELLVVNSDFKLSFSTFGQYGSVNVDS